ncbi:MAG: hypothetical protein ACBR20_11710 [Microcoleus sp.]
MSPHRHSQHKYPHRSECKCDELPKINPVKESGIVAGKVADGERAVVSPVEGVYTVYSL